MNGLGNDFIIIDTRPMPDFMLTAAQIRHLAERDHSQTGGCDQLLLIRPALDTSISDIFLSIYNCDGSEVGACGNGTRAIGAYLHRQKAQAHYRIATQTTQDTAITTYLDKDKQGLVHSTMPPPYFVWDKIPLSQNIDTTSLLLDEALPPAFMVNVGNPHAVIFVDDDPASHAKKYGATLETHALFPDNANINFAHLIDDQTINLHTWERGAGLTQACGTGAYATAIAAIESHKTKVRQIYIRPPSFTDATPDNFIYVDYTDPQNPQVSGIVQFDFEGEIAL